MYLNSPNQTFIRRKGINFIDPKKYFLNVKKYLFCSKNIIALMQKWKTLK